MSSGDGRRAMGMSGATRGTNGAALDAKVLVPWIAYLGLGLFLVAVDTVNVFSALHDLKGRVEAWEPAVWEYSSGAMSLLLMPLVAQALRIAPPSHRRWRRFALVHVLSSLAYSLIHVGGFLILRKLVYAALGHSYRFGPLSEFVYEYRKDLLAYIVCLTVFAFAARREPPAILSAPDAGTPLATAMMEPPTFDIRDGARLIRVLTADIITVTAAGNYVEFRLQDGRRPLMRTTLSRVEATLSAHGFVRTHRSWLVNAARLRSVAAEGSGDYQLELDTGVQAPLSRRFPDALTRLRQG